MPKTYPGVLRKIAEAMGNGNVIHHPATEENRIGQSGIHTFVDDIMNIIEDAGLKGVWDSELQRTIYKELHKYILQDRIKF